MYIYFGEFWCCGEERRGEETGFSVDSFFFVLILFDFDFDFVH